MTPPRCLSHYLHMWNATEAEEVHHHRVLAVTDAVHFVDPNDDIRSGYELEASVVEQRRRHPDARFEVTSRIDGHHHRYRYHWRRISSDGILDGFDVTTISPDGRIERIDGFFGQLATS